MCCDCDVDYRHLLFSCGSRWQGGRRAAKNSNFFPSLVVCSEAGAGKLEAHVILAVGRNGRMLILSGVQEKYGGIRRNEQCQHSLCLCRTEDILGGFLHLTRYVPTRL